MRGRRKEGGRKDADTWDQPVSETGDENGRCAMRESVIDTQGRSVRGRTRCAGCGTGSGLLGRRREALADAGLERVAGLRANGLEQGGVSGCWAGLRWRAGPGKRRKKRAAGKGTGRLGWISVLLFFLFLFPFLSQTQLKLI